MYPRGITTLTMRFSLQDNRVWEVYKYFVCNQKSEYPWSNLCTARIPMMISFSDVILCMIRVPGYETKDKDMGHSSPSWKILLESHPMGWASNFQVLAPRLDKHSQIPKGWFLLFWDVEKRSFGCTSRSTWMVQLSFCARKFLASPNGYPIWDSNFFYLTFFSGGESPPVLFVTFLLISLPHPALVGLSICLNNAFIFFWMANKNKPYSQLFPKGMICIIQPY